LRHRPRLPLENLAPFLLNPPDPPAPLDWRQVFGHDRSVELEIGCGKGLFLLNAALACPQVNFVGVEIQRKYQLFTATRLAKRGLGNVRLVCADARSFLSGWVKTGSLQAVHVYFPDPWWKKRHHKRRLFTPEFAAQCARILQPQGFLHVVTDVEEYWGLIRDLLGQQAGLSFRPPPQPKYPEHDLDYLTNFERKFRKQSKAIFRGRYQKIAPDNQ
jgi:tRNA (guanine-N7-)-methyltransferase